MIAIISPRAGGAPRHEINRTFSLGELLGRERRCVQPCRTLIGSGFKLSACYVGPLGVAGSHQYQNAALAVELSRIFLKSKTSLDFDEALPEAFKQALTKTCWPGRCQTIPDPAYPQTTWLVDGAHTHESLQYALEWFVAPDTALRQSES